MSQISLLTSNPRFSEASQIIPTLNYLIPLLNTAFGASGSGSTSSAIYIPTVASAVDLLSITPAATGGPVVLTVGGDASDTNAGLLLTGKGSGVLSLGGSTSANASLRVVTLANSANYLQVTGATSASPTVTIAVGGATTSANLALTAATTGTIQYGSAGSFSANGTVASAMTASQGPTNARSDIQKWLRILDNSGASFFMPLW